MKFPARASFALVLSMAVGCLAPRPSAIGSRSDDGDAAAPASDVASPQAAASPSDAGVPSEAGGVPGSAAPLNTETGALACTDGEDNDVDGVIDCADPDCTVDDVPACECAALCAASAPFCRGADLVEECARLCAEDYASWQPETVRQFAYCLREDPLCYEDITTCLLGQLYPEGPPAHLTLKGSGFDEWEGRDVLLRLREFSSPARIEQTTIAHGAFVFSLDYVAPFHNVTSGDFVSYYVDVNDSETCDPGTDVTRSVQVPFLGDVENLAFGLEVTPVGRSNDSICSSM